MEAGHLPYRDTARKSIMNRPRTGKCTSQRVASCSQRIGDSSSRKQLNKRENRLDQTSARFPKPASLKYPYAPSAHSRGQDVWAPSSGDSQNAGPCRSCNRISAALSAMGNSLHASSSFSQSFFDQPFKVPQLGGTKTIVTAQGNRPEPEFCLKIIASDMDVRRLCIFTAAGNENDRALPSKRLAWELNPTERTDGSGSFSKLDKPRLF